MALELEKERTRSRQLESALGFLVGSEQERVKSLEEQLGRAGENRSRLEVEITRREMVESEVKALRLENSYLKDLILVANDNYQKLEERNGQLIESMRQLEQQLEQKETDMFQKTEELRVVLAGMVDKGVPETEVKVLSPKGGKVRQAEDAYRSIFSKTLRPRK